MVSATVFRQAIGRIERDEGFRTDQGAMSFIEMSFLGTDVSVSLSLKEQALQRIRADLGDLGVFISAAVNFNDTEKGLVLKKGSEYFNILYDWCKSKCVPHLTLDDNVYLKVSKHKIRFLFLMEHRDD